MNLVLGLCQRGFEAACQKHVLMISREFQRYLYSRRCYQYVTMHTSTGLPDGTLFEPKYNSIYVYVLCHTSQRNGEEYMHINGKDDFLVDDKFVEWLKRFRCNHMTLVLETCHSEGINDLESPTMPDEWTVINTSSKNQKSLFDEVYNIGAFTSALCKFISIVRVPLFTYSPNSVVTEINRMRIGENVTCHGDTTKWIYLPVEAVTEHRTRRQRLCSN